MQLTDQRDFRWSSPPTNASLSIEQAVKCIELLLLRKTRCLVKEYGNNLKNVRTDDLIDPRTYCKLGHFNLLLENYSKGIFADKFQCTELIVKVNSVKWNSMMNSSELNAPKIQKSTKSPVRKKKLIQTFPFPALSAYQKYFSLVEDNWRVSFTVDTLWCSLVCTPTLVYSHL